MLYRINYILSLLVMVMALLLIPGLVRGYFKERYDAARFSDVDIYLHQISYSFTRTPKINMALRDVYEISSGNLEGMHRKGVRRTSIWNGRQSI